MNLFDRVNAMFNHNTNLQGVPVSLLNNSLVENLTTHLVIGLVNQIESHSTFVANLMNNQQLNNAELHNYNMQLVSLLSALKPQMDTVAAKYPELLPVITLAENYDRAFQVPMA